MIQFYNLTERIRFVYAIKGLPLEDNEDSVPHPCTDNARSRWELVESEDCNPTMTIGVLTNLTLMTLLSNSIDSNPFLRDIYFTQGLQCNETDISLGPSIELLVDGQCWRHVHPDHLSVYDVSNHNEYLREYKNFKQFF